MTIIEISIGPGPAAGKYRVEVVSSPGGEASVLVELDTDGLVDQRERLQYAVLASGVPSRRLLPQTERPVRAVGEALFTALLGTGQVASLYRSAALEAARDGSGLRVVLRIDTPALAALPWETMYDKEAGAYVCRRDQLVRHVKVASVAAPLRVKPPLRILGVVSSPRGPAELDVQAERDQLARALDRPIQQGLAELHWAPRATWSELQELLLEGEWHVLHFVGHGDFDHNADEGLLVLERKDGRPDLVAAHRVVDLLRQARPMPRLVVLNSCSGAATGLSDLFSSTAATLVRGGVSAVAAMQYEISDPAATEFARGFYSAIARGRGVDDAVSSGRVAILGLSDRTLEWVTPVLYLRGYDSHLFTLTEPAASPPATPAAPRPAADTASHFAGPGPIEALAATAGPSPAVVAAPRLAGVLGRHSAYVTAVAFSPDGSLLATASGDGTVRLWNTGTRETVHILTGHEEGVSGVAFSPDGAKLASVGGDRILRLWRVATGRPLRTTEFGRASYLAGVAFRPPHGDQVAAAGWDGEVWLCGTGRGASIGSLPGSGERMSAVAFSPDGSLLAAADNGAAQLWNMETGRTWHPLIGHRQPVTDVAFSPDGRLLGTASADRTARLRDVAAGGTTLQILTGHTDKVLGLAFSPDGRLLATVGEDRTLRLWEVATGMPLSTVVAHDGSVSAVAFSPDGTLLATASADNTARLWTDLPQP